MSLVLTLVGEDLSPAVVETARRALDAGAPLWLAPGRACDLRLGAGDARAAEGRVRAALGGAKVDLCIQPTEGRRKKLLVSDMDSTVITVECIDEVADAVGRKSEVAAITEAAMRGEIGFEDSLKRRIGYLIGIAEETLSRVYDERVELMPGARTLVATMRRHGAYSALVSSGFSFFTAKVREAVGFDVDRANRLLIEDGKIAGIGGPILGAESKVFWLEKIAASRGLTLAETAAVGDGANDVPMIRAAGLGVAFRAKPITAAAARARVDHGDLTTLLYFQGYAREEFAA